MSRVRIPGAVLCGLVAFSTLFASARAMGQFMEAGRRKGPISANTDDGSIYGDNQSRLLQRWRQDVLEARRRRKRVNLDDPTSKRRGALMQPVPSTGQYVYFPTARPNDAAFLALSEGSGVASLSNDLYIKLATPAGQNTLELGIFDGDNSGLWDHGAATTTFTLYVDPTADGSGAQNPANQMEQWSTGTSTFADNTWTNLTAGGTVNGGTLIQVGAQTTAPSGARFFVLKISVSNASGGAVNGLKVRTTSSVRLQPQDSFNIIAPMSTLAEANIVYPSYPSTTPTRYDGTWDIYSYVPNSIEYDPSDNSKPTAYEVWDGDFDYGSRDLSSTDTDDVNTPNSVALLPDWARNSNPVAEGVAVGLSGATGNPADDSLTPFVRTGLTFDITDPGGTRYTNLNPSGNSEWERFRIETNPNTKNNVSVADGAAPEAFLPAGVYQLHINGLDLSNLASLRFEHDVLGVDQYGNPVQPVLPYLIGDTVYIDTNGNGTQDLGETGVNGVALSMVDSNGNVMQSTTTANVGGVDGRYSFNVDAGTYTVRIEPESFNSGPLAGGYRSTTGGESLTFKVTTANVLSYDFGYQLPTSGSLGDLVWLDQNGNGTREAGEPGIGGVTVTLSGGDSRTTTTDVNGFYLFTGLDVSADTSYTVTVSGTPLNGMTRTYDADGIATARTSTIILGPSRLSDLGQDFGFIGSSSIGDFIWNDVSPNGTFDRGTDVGLANVRVLLTWDFEGDGSVDLRTSTTTDANGYYLFSGLPPATAPGKYVVRVDTQTLPLGMILVADPDGVATPSYSSLTLAAGAADLAQDFGYRGAGKIGDTVWFDANSNQQKDASESGIANVTLTLTADYNLDGKVDYTATTTTDANGNYLFNNLPSGRYIVTVQNGSGTAVNSWTPTYDYDGTGTAHTATVGLPARASILDVDFGYTNVGVSPASIGDFVWLDSNANGVQDSGEIGLPGVQVSLYNSALPGGTQIGSTQTTANSGAYYFGNLTPGTYYVRFLLPSGYGFATKANSSATASGTDSDADNTGTGNSLLAQTAAVVLTSSQNVTTVDAGAYKTASVGDYVWLDANRDGIQGTDESGISGVTVTLRKADGTLAAATQANPQTTTASGGYLFSGLTPGSYYVVFSTLPTSYGFTFKGVGSDSSKDSDVNTGSGQTDTFALVSGQARTDVDAGAYSAGSIGNYVWLDDGTTANSQDASDHPLAGAKVQLFDATSNLQIGATQTTGADGLYSFTGLAAGTYYVVFTLPNGYQFVTQGVGTASTNSDANITTGRTANITLTNGQTNVDIDAGAKLYSANTNSVGDFVWTDSNANGVQDAGEGGIPGVTVQLWKVGNGSATATATTGSDGSYLFSNVADDAGTNYYVKFVLPSGYTFSPKANSNVTTSTTDSDADTTTGQTATFALTNGTHLTSVDAGMYQTCSVGDIVWLDANGNGVQNFTDLNGNGRWDSGEPGEAGLSGVSVALFKSDGTPVGSAQTTTSAGTYSFTGLLPGSFYVQLTLPSGYKFTGTLQGGDSSRDSDAVAQSNPLVGKTATFSLTGGQTLTTIDAGAYLPAAIGNFVWSDTDKDGIQDGGEPGLDGVQVKLYTGSGSLVGSTTTTGGTGLYSFTGLVPGSYYVSFTLPAGYKFTALNNTAGTAATDSDASPSSGLTTTYTLTSGQTNNDVDAGATDSGTASVGDTIWLDTNRDGILNNGEVAVGAGVGTITVKLFDSTGVQVGASKTTTNGSYSFTNLDAGSYYVQFSLPSGSTYRFSGQGLGGNTATDSDADPSTGKTAIFSLGRGQTRTDLDAGVNTAVSTASVGDFVWIDWNGNGIQDFADANGNGVQDSGETTEPGLSGVTVKLFDSTTSAQVSTTKTTDANGAYSFTGLSAGSYYVQFTLPSSYSFSPKLQGSNTVKDSDADTSTGKTSVFSLASGQALLTIDAGAYIGACLGGTVWFDANRDTIFQYSESGIGSVTVKLSGPNGLTRSTITDSTGKYSFLGLSPGFYTVTVDATTIPTSIIPATTRYRTNDYDGSTTTPDTSSYDLQQGENCGSMNFGYAVAPAVPSPGNYTTFTIGGWGAVPKGGNPGGKLHAGFATAFPSGVTLGNGTSTNGSNAEWVQLKFTTAQAITDYLPDGATPSKLVHPGTPQNAVQVRTNPLTTEAGVLASQALAVKLAIQFGDSGLLPKPNSGSPFLGDLKYYEPTNTYFHNKTLRAILAEAELVLGGKQAPATGAGGYSGYNKVLTNINETFDNGTVDKGYARP